jgi:hypothetical protein
MNTITLPTDLHCERCAAKLKPQLDGDARIHHWSIDLRDPQRPVTVHGDVGPHDVEQHLAAAGYRALPVAQAKPTLEQKPRFWADRAVWKRSALNTFSCLVGCSIGDFAMIAYLQGFRPETPMLVQMMLATAAGLITSIALESVLMRYRERFSWGQALRMALSMSFLSMVAMEVVMNLTDLMITGGRLGLSDPRFWLAFAPSALAGFLVPLPYNYFQLKKHNKACH